MSSNKTPITETYTRKTRSKTSLRTNRWLTKSDHLNLHHLMLTHSLIPHVILLVNYYLFVCWPTITSAPLLVLPSTTTDYGGRPRILGHHLSLVHEGRLTDYGWLACHHKLQVVVLVQVGLLKLWCPLLEGILQMIRSCELVQLEQLQGSVA